MTTLEQMNMSRSLRNRCTDLGLYHLADLEERRAAAEFRMGRHVRKEIGDLLSFLPVAPEGETTGAKHRRYLRMKEEFGYTNRQIALREGISRSRVSQIVTRAIKYRDEAQALARATHVDTSAMRAGLETANEAVARLKGSVTGTEALDKLPDIVRRLEDMAIRAAVETVKGHPTCQRAIRYAAAAEALEGIRRRRLGIVI